MKRIIALILALTMVLLMAGCGGKAEAETIQTEAPATVPETTAEPTTEPTTVPTTEPEPVYFNPLNGEILEEPYTGRIFANTVSNIRDAIPHVGVTKADILFESFVNNSIIRCLALYTDITDVELIGSTRSTRLMFNDIAQHYNLILSHAGGSSLCLGNADDRGLDHFNIDSLDRQGDPYAQETGDRRTDLKKGEHSLFGKGKGLYEYAVSQGIEVTQPADKDYQLRFTEDGTPAGGEPADEIDITITYGESKKGTQMKYDQSLGKYVYYQYDQMMADQVTGEPEAFENVIVMFASIEGVPYHKAVYQQADFLAGGTGYYACGGKLIPITWSCDSDTTPFRFTTENGEVLEMGQGNSYIAITTPGSNVTWTQAEAPVETTAETTAETAAEG